jgi:hypothetical protein
MGCIGSSEPPAPSPPPGAAEAAPAISVTASTYVETRKGYPDTLTDRERTVMAQLRAQLAAAGITDKRWDDDHEICRWLRARKFDVPATLLMIRNHVTWEKDFDVDTVYKTFAHKDPLSIKRAYPRAYHRTDRVGRPINIDCVGRLDIKQLNELTSNEEMVKEKIQEMVRARATPSTADAARPPLTPFPPSRALSRAPLRPQEYTLRVRYPACSKAAGRTINQSVVIMDLSGLSMSIWSSQTRHMLQRLIGVLSDHYPETMGVLFIVNAPVFFAGIWAFAKLFLDPGTVQKISILSSNYKAELDKVIDPSALPPFLGGTDADFDFVIEQGPWVKDGHRRSKRLSNKETVTFDERRRRRWFACCGA